MEKRYFIIGVIIPLFLLGLLGCCTVIAGIRRGEFIYKGGRWIRGHDGWGFWLVVATAALAALGMMFGAVWFGIRIIQNNL